MDEVSKEARPLPGLDGFVVATRQLLGSDDTSPIGASALYYPLIGLVLGAAMALLNEFILGRLSIEATSLAVTLAYVAATRGRPLHGLGRSAALSLKSPAARDSTFIAASFKVLFFSLAVLLLSKIDSGRAIALLYAPMLARCAMVVIATGSREAREDGRQTKFSRELSFREFGIASTVTFGVVFLTTHFLGLILVTLTGILTIALRLLVHRLRGGVDRDSMHACGEIVQMTTLAVFALI